MRNRVAKIRIEILRVISVALLAVAVVMDPILLGTFWGRVLWDAGALLVFAGVLGRFWSILYIGDKKQAEVVQQGPYSICRHPLYLFSTIAAFGFALMLQSVIFALVLAVLVFLVLFRTADFEEENLRAAFGPAYDEYAKVTPRILPRLSDFQTPPNVTFNVAAMRANFTDALVFLSLIPVAEVINWWNGTGALGLIRLI